MKEIAFFSKTKNSRCLAGFWLCWLAAFLLPAPTLVAQCNPDVTPPTANCKSALTLQTNQHGANTTRLYAAALTNGSQDNCTPTNALSLRATLDPANTPPSTNFVMLNGINTFAVYLWVGDQAGNWSRCAVQVNTTAPQCTPDLTQPTITPDPDVTISKADYDSLQINFANFLDAMNKINAAFGTPIHWDNCDNGNNQLEEAYALFNNLDGSLKSFERRFYVRDNANNTSRVNQYVTITPDHYNPDYIIHVPGWRYPETATVTDSMRVKGPNHIVPFWGSDSIYAASCTGGYSKIDREWVVINWLDPTELEATLPALDINNDGLIGDAYDIIVIGDSVWLYQNKQPTQRLMKRAQVYHYQQLLLNSRPLRGVVHLDTLQNCAFDIGEAGLNGFKVKAIGQVTQNVYTAFTNAQGAYELLICPEDTLVEVGLDVPYNYGGSCLSSYFVPMLAGPPMIQNIAVPLNTSCTLLVVDIATWRLRPCRAGTYTVNYCNYSAQPVENTYIDVALDTFIQLDSAALASTWVGGNTYRFQTGTLQAGACDQFTIHFTLACNVPLGLTHCTEAHIYPTDDCPPAAPWSGADLRVSGVCDGDSVRLQIKNIGGAGMAQPLEFVVTEDLIMAKSAPYQLTAGGTLTVSEPSNGATWRLETPQEPGHPWGGIVASVVEGCGGLNTPGLVNIFPINNVDPYSSSDCTQNTAAYDPNDKQAFPQGYREQHFIKANTDIEYMIRFQNTGTDTAFTVVLLDTLSAALDAQAIRPGAASHSYDFDVLTGNVLRFRFDNILLPDSNVNEVASHGYVKFRIRQRPDNPLGTVIHNRAGIYFDFNAPVMTNTTWHTIGDDFLMVHTDPVPAEVSDLRVYPNPAAETVFFELPQIDPKRQFQLMDALGRTLIQQPFADTRFRFECGQLPAGLYFYRIAGAQGLLHTGSIFLKG